MADDFEYTDSDGDKLTVAIHGREIAAIVYVDELPVVHEFSQHVEAGEGTAQAAYVDSYGAEVARARAVNFLAIARHLEARDAARADEDREVEALAESARKVAPGYSDVSLLNIARHFRELGARPDGGAS